MEEQLDQFNHSGLLLHISCNQKSRETPATPDTWVGAAAQESCSICNCWNCNILDSTWGDREVGGTALSVFTCTTILYARCHHNVFSPQTAGQTFKQCALY